MKIATNHNRQENA